eukprot:6477442-Pyramimonas_sp.AAC.1
MKTWSWALVDDDEQLSAKKRKERGMSRFENNKDISGLIKMAFMKVGVSLPDAADGDDNDDDNLIVSEPTSYG